MDGYNAARVSCSKVGALKIISEPKMWDAGGLTVIGLRSLWRLNFLRHAVNPSMGARLKDPSFRRPTKLISIAHRQSLTVLESANPSPLSIKNQLSICS